jgi:predicted nucleotide-binding protein
LQVKKSKRFEDVHFSAEALSEIYSKFQKSLGILGEENPGLYAVDVDGGELTHDNFSEFLADYRRTDGDSSVHFSGGGVDIWIFQDRSGARVSVQHAKRGTVEDFFAVFEKHAKESRLHPSTGASSEPQSVSKRMSFDRVHFSGDVLAEALNRTNQLLGFGMGCLSATYSVHVDGAEWGYGSFSEFLSDYRRTTGNARLDLLGRGVRLEIGRFETYSTIAVKCQNRVDLESIFSIFERHVATSRIPGVVEATDKPRVFIGHGRDYSWRELKDHLQDKHGYRVVAYEIGARAGHAVRDILEEMLDESNFALLVATGEDLMDDGTTRARQNVVHEIGLFQGRLGFKRAIVLLEHGTEEFSNIHGIEQVRFSKGNIKEVFGDVLATIRREFAAEK